MLVRDADEDRPVRERLFVHRTSSTTRTRLMYVLGFAFFLSVTLSWDEFIIAFLLTRFDITLPVEIWSMMRSGLSPSLNAIGSFVFLISVAALLMLEFIVLRRRK